MRVERKGGPPDLQSAFKRFIVDGLNGRSLDDDANREAALGKFPDFACCRDILLIEMKHLEAGQGDRLNSTYQKHVIPEEHPVFYGSRAVDFDRLSNGEEIKEALASRLAKTLETHLRKANSQIRDYRLRHPRKNSVGICVLLNSQLLEFSPELVLHSVHRKMQPAGQGLRFEHIDAVVYISEKHFQKLPDGRIAFGIGVVENRGVDDNPWKGDFITMLVEKWSTFRTGDATVWQSLETAHFDNVEDIPQRMTRSDAWRLAYTRSPYLRHFPDRKLKIHFQRCVGLSSLSFFKGGWEKPSAEETQEAIRAFSDAVEEINSRGLDMRKFDPRLLSDDELRTAYAGLPKELVDMLMSRASSA